MAKTQKPTDYVDLSFPLAGLDVSMGFARQPARPLGGGRYAKTTPVGVNVRAYEPGTGRCRGGSRPGLSRYINAIPGGSAALIQFLGVVVGSGYTPPGGTTQSSQSSRVVTLVAIVAGVVYICDAGGTSWTTATNDTGSNPPMNATGVIRGAVLAGKLYLVGDGTKVCYYDPSDNKVKTWGASEGVFPTDSSSRFPRLICLWRGRIVMSGLQGDPQNWFMSEVGDATNFNYSPDTITPTQAVAGNISSLGLIGAPVTGLVPFNDDVLGVLCDSSVSVISGDPMAGGVIGLTTDAIGGVFGEAWCKDAESVVWFFSNRGSIFRWAPGQQPMLASQAIDPLLTDINTGTYAIRMLWDERLGGMHVFVTKTSAAFAATHFYYEAPRGGDGGGAWWKDTFANNNMNPLACCTFDGNEETDRVSLIGSWDGYVRAVDRDAETDDTEDIESEVVLGPIMPQGFDDMLLREIQADMGESSGDVDYAVHVGRIAETALTSTAVHTGTWTAGRNQTNMVRRAGHAIYIRVSSTERWAMERVRASVLDRGKVRARSAY